jgi:macrolide-specific efflux system membrane fusion protein
MKKALFWSILVIAVFAVVAWFAIGDRLVPEKQQPDHEFERVKVVRRDIGSAVRATGIIKPMDGADVRVGSRVSGLVKRLHAGIGDRVNQGDLLVELDATELKARYNQDAAALSMAEANLKYARLDVERKRELFKKNFISREDLDLAENTFEVAALGLEEAEANLEYSKIQLRYAKIYAPISGVVSSVSVQEGETVAASFSAPTFLTILDLDRLEVWAYVDETDIGRIEVGQAATFTVDTYLDVDFRGMVSAIYPKAEIQDNVVNYITLINIEDNQGKILRPEMTTVVSIFMEQREDVLAVPKEAVHRERGRKYVFVPGAEGPERRGVRVGWSDGDHTEILEGLEENETVLLGDIIPQT